MTHSGSHRELIADDEPESRFSDLKKKKKSPAFTMEMVQKMLSLWVSFSFCTVGFRHVP